MKKATRYAASHVGNQRLCADFCRAQNWSADDLSADIFLRGCSLIESYFDPIEDSSEIEQRILTDTKIGFWPWFRMQYTLALRQYLSQSREYGWEESCNNWIEGDRLHNLLYHFIIQNPNL